MHFMQMTSKNDTYVMKILTSGVSKNIKIIIFWDVTSCSLLEIYSGFVTICCLPLQCKVGNQQFLPRNIGKFVSEYTASHPAVLQLA
jgi:hypothetical protein